MAEPLPTAYFNGTFLPLADVRISPLDRGFLFGDGIYEVIPAYNGRLFHLPEHLERLQYSLDCIHLENPLVQAEWSSLLDKLVARNGSGDQAVYLQLTRGVDNVRDHAFPTSAPPTVFAMSAPLAKLSQRLKTRGAKIMTLEDIRWQRCDIKSVALLGNVLLRQQATDLGCDEAILVRSGHANEGTASSLFIVHKNLLITPPKSSDLLPSITRDVVLALARDNGIPMREAFIPLEQLREAEEVWLASSTREVYAVTELDGRKLGNGEPGPLWRHIYDLFQRHKAELLSARP